MIWAVVSAAAIAAAWLLLGAILAIVTVNWHYAHVARWQGVLDRDGRVRATSTRTGIAIVFADFMLCGPYHLFLGWWRRRRLRRHGNTP